MTHLKLLAVYFAARDLIKVLKDNQDPQEAINRLVRVVEDVKLDESEEPND